MEKYNSKFFKQVALQVNKNMRYVFEKNDFIECILNYDCNTKRCFLTFERANNLTGERIKIGRNLTSKCKEWQSGKIWLNCNDFYYYIGFSSLRCSCVQPKYGFQFAVETS